MAELNYLSMFHLVFPINISTSNNRVVYGSTLFTMILRKKYNLILIILILEHTVATACSNKKTIGLLRRVASLGRQLDSISYLRTSEFWPDRNICKYTLKVFTKNKFINNNIIIIHTFIFRIVSISCWLCNWWVTIGLLRRVASLGRQLDSISYLRTSEFWPDRNICSTMCLIWLCKYG
jgi:hypothetical protein